MKLEWIKPTQLQPVILPQTGTVEKITAAVPTEIRDTHIKKWKEVVNLLVTANDLEDGKGVRNAETDVLFCRRFYAEPEFRYDEQKSYWLKQPSTTKAMAHNIKFSN